MKLLKKYCISKGRFHDDYIDRVQFGSIDNTTGKGTGYTFFSNLSTELLQESTNTITITPGFIKEQYEEGDGYGVWIDYNQDGDFFDANETVWTKVSSTDSPVSGTFIVPIDAKPGTTRMRVVMKYGDTPEPCEEDVTYGEIEDYKVVIKSSNGDITSPSKPTNLQVSDITMSTATLTWNASTDNIGVAGYDVYQGTTLLTTTTNTTLDVTGLSPLSPYTYAVKAKDASNNVSKVANVVFTTLSNEDKPTAPRNLRAPTVTLNSVNLVWDASTDKNGGVITYEVYKSRRKIGTTTNTSFEVTGLLADKSYYFYVKAKDPEGNASNESNDLKVFTSNYCISKGTSSEAEWISYVGLTNLRFTSGSNKGYGGFTHRSATIRRGSRNKLTVGIRYKNTRYRNRIVVWIDFNGNGIFEGNEKRMSKIVSRTGNYDHYINVPANAKLGKTRMRVSAKRYIGEQGPCAIFSRGEVEDYSIIITGTNTFTGIDADANSNEISIYPNPVSDILNIKLSSATASATFKIINVAGKVVKSGALESSQLNISNLHTGMYILEVNDGQKLLQTKILKK